MNIPPLKWAGGKRWLVRRYPSLFSLSYDRYVEPFLGSGAVYFHLSPAHALIGDKNTELMNFYACLRDSPATMVELMRKHSAAQRAARFLYLNRTCWNGLYRENRRGEFNVPIGTKSAVLYQDENFIDIARLLGGAELSSGDFVGIIAATRKGDFLFVDPPYTVKHNSNGFIKYNEQIFSWEDQERLADECIKAKNRGVNVMITNAAHESVLSLYSAHGEALSLSRHSVLAGKASARGQAAEALILLGNGFGDIGGLLNPAFHDPLVEVQPFRAIEDGSDSPQ